MIRIYRGEEPETLAKAREEHLARAELRGVPPGAAELVDYDVARRELFDRHYDKCAYCEMHLRIEGVPIEHHRPKLRADRVDWTALRTPTARTDSERAASDDALFARGLPPSDRERVRWVSDEGYWWLTWTWENQLAACVSCNCAGLKGTRFPLVRGSSRLTSGEQSPGREGGAALLIDPTITDPMEHIRFVYDGRHWRPVARDRSAMGAWTITVFDLAGPSLLKPYAVRVRDLEGHARRLDAALSGTPAECRAEWEALCDRALYAEAPLLALTHDWLDQRYPRELRDSWGVTLERPALCLPGIDRASPPRPAWPPRTELDGLPRELRLRVRVARNAATQTPKAGDPPRSDQMPLPDLLYELVKARPATSTDLASLLDRSEAYLRDLLRNDVRLTLDPTTRVWRAT